MTPNNCWVIGGTSGIGQATAWQLRQSHRSVVVTGEDVDVRYADYMERAVKSWMHGLEKEELGKPNEIVYSAGVNHLQWIDGVTDEALYDVFDINVMGFIRLLGVLRSCGLRDLRVVAIGSDASTRPMRTSITYCASKAALDQAVRVAARELAHYGWRVNAVNPGMVSDTKMTEYIDKTVPTIRGWTHEEHRAYEEHQAVIPRRGTPEEVAQMVQSVLEGPDWLNGSIITLNGGR